MISGRAKVGAHRSGSSVRGFAAAMILSTSAFGMTNNAWLATLVPTSKVRPTLCFAVGRSTPCLLATHNEAFVSTVR